MTSKFRSVLRYLSQWLAIAGYRRSATVQAGGLRLRLLIALSNLLLLLILGTPPLVYAAIPSVALLMAPPIDLTTQARQTFFGIDADDRSGILPSAKQGM